MALGPLRFNSQLRPLIWGGRRLETVLGRALPEGEAIAESWELVDLPGAVSVVDEGPHQGVPLDNLVSEQRASLLGLSRLSPRGRFPLLVKLLDAHRMLSVQVHPSEESVTALGDAEARPKTEAWFVLHAEPDARLLIGLRPGVGPAEVQEAIKGDGLPDLLVPHPAQAGDVFLIEAGTVHCLGSGVVLAEIQQPSDTTYRLYDWGRGRQLHVEAALKSIRWDRPAPRRSDDAVACEAFSARWIRGGGPEVAMDRARVVVATSAGRIGADLTLAPGDTILLPASCPSLVVEDADYIRVELP
jgi:mannose-6-phosphate isomerase